MQRIDALIVGALIVAAAGSFLGAFAYEDDRLAEFSIDWTVQRTTALAEPVTHEGQGEVAAALDIATPNITSIAFTVTVSGGPARLQPTAVRVDVVSPTNNTTSLEGELPVGTGSVELPVEVELAAIPDATTITGPTLDAARRALNAMLSSSLGTGTWTIRVSFAPATPGPLGGQESHTVAAVAQIKSYQGTLTVIGPEVGR